MCCTRLSGNTGRKNLPSGHHRTTVSGCIFAITTKACIDKRKKIVQQQYLLHMTLQYGEHRPTRGWHRSGLGTPANFNGFCVLAVLLQRCRSPEANQTLLDVWPSLGVVHYIYIFGGSCPLMEFCQVQNSLCIHVLHSSILAALLHGTPLHQQRQPNFAAWYTEWNYGTWVDGATYIWLGVHYDGHRPTF